MRATLSCPIGTTCIRPALIGLALLGASGAFAQGANDRTWLFGVDQAFRHTNNLFRAPDGGGVVSDTSSATGLLGEVTVPLGRQRVYAAGNVRALRYRLNESLDHTSHDLEAGVRWATAGRLSGVANLKSREVLAPFGADAFRRTTARNLLRTREANAVATLGLVTQWTAEVSAQHRTNSYTDPTYAGLNYEQDRVTAGVRYRPNPDWSVGIDARRSEGRYPQFRPDGAGGFIADQYTRNDIDLLTTWKPSGASSLTGRLSYGRQTNRQATQRDFSAATGLVSWAYQPTGKLNLVTTLVRDSGTEARFADSINSASFAAGNDISRLSNAIQLAATYAVSGKLSLYGAVNRTERSLVNTAPGGAALGGTDVTRVGSLGIRYAPNRNWALDCGVTRESRDTDTALSYAFNARVIGCSAQFLVY